MSDKNYNAQYSQYNSAAQEISRTDSLFQKCHSLRSKGELKALNYELDGIWLELSGDKNLQPQDIENYYVFQKLYGKYKLDRNKVYQILIKKEMFLRKLQNRLGKGSKYKEEDDSGM